MYAYHGNIYNHRDDYAVLGRSQSDMLSEDETKLCDECGITVFSPEILVYSGLIVSNSTITSVTRSQTTKRSNSCVMIEGAKYTRGLVEKVFSFKNADSSPYYCLVSLLRPIKEQLCTDMVTNARLEDHFVACEPPR